jgi:hypothetical protein
MRTSFSAIVAALALACNETPTEQTLDTSREAANVACGSCGLEHFTLTASIKLIQTEIEAGDPEDLPLPTFSCDSWLFAEHFEGIAIDNRDPQNVGSWHGKLSLQPGPPPQFFLPDSPFAVEGGVSVPDGRAWIGFFVTAWDPGARTCEIADGVMRIRIHSRFGAAMSTVFPNGDAGSGSVPGFISGHLDLAPDFSVLSSFFSVPLFALEAPASVALSPSQDSPALGEVQVMTATVNDALLGPAANAAVVFAITGASATTLACTTDAAGQCTVSYTGPAAPGIDLVTAFADIDGDGRLSLGEPSAIADIRWGDVTPPIVATPPPIIAEATGPSGAVVSFALPQARDDVAVVGGVACTPPSGSLFPLGSTSVTCAASDAAGNIGTTSFQVRVVDTTPPAITFSGNAGTYTVDQPVSIQCSATDLVTASPTVTCSGGTGPAYQFNLGSNEVVATAIDQAENESTASSSFVVVVTVESICTLVRTWSNGAASTSSACKALSGLSEHLSPAQRAHLIEVFIRSVERQIGRAIPADKAAILIRLASAL